MHTQETKSKISAGVIKALLAGAGRGNKFTACSSSTARAARGAIGPSTPERLLSAAFEDLSYENKRVRLALEQGGKCAGCQLGEWRGTQIALELEHKNGIREDDRRENLEMLCPNCHSQTETWRGRNKPLKNGNTDVSDSDLKAALAAEPNIRKALLGVGLAAKGNNYKRAQRLMLD